MRFVLRRRLHEPVPEQGAFLPWVVLEHVRNCGVPPNGPSLMSLRCARRALLVLGAAAPQPDCAPHGALAADSRICHSVPQSAPGVLHPRWEPDAVMPHVRICGGGGKRWGAESRDAAAPAFARRGWHRGLHSLPSPLLLIPTAGKVLTTAGPPGPVHTASSDPPIPQRPNPRRTVRGIAVLRES